MKRLHGQNIFSFPADAPLSIRWSRKKYVQDIVARMSSVRCWRLSLRGGQQLRADGGVDHVLADGGHRLVKAPAQIAHQAFHQRFGHGAVDVVHAHVIAIVGAKAESATSLRSPVPSTMPPTLLA